MPCYTKYALIDIHTFTEKAALVEGIYQYIIQSAWAVTSLTSSKFLGVGFTGISPIDWNTSTFPYIAWINGSTYIENFCLLNDNVSISKSLEINDDLLVRGNTNFKNLVLENATINNNVSINNNADISNNLFVHNNTELNNLIVFNNTSMNMLNVTGMALFNNVSMNNISMNNASMNNASISNVTINRASINNISMNNASVDYINISTSTIYNLDVTTISTIDISSNNAIITNASINNASFDFIFVNNVSVVNTLTATTIDTINMSNTNIYSTNISNNNNASFNNVTILGKTSLFVDAVNNNPLIISKPGTSNAMPDSNGNGGGNSDIFIFPPTYIALLYSDIIYCDTIRSKGSTIISFENIGKFTLFRQTNPVIDGIFALGVTSVPIIYNAYTCGAMSHGIGNTLDPTTVNTFDLSANSANVGIIYNGPVNIGQNTPSSFNLNATGNIKYSGTLTITGTTTAEGVLNVTQNLLVGGNITSYSDIKLKDNIKKLTNSLDKIDNINGYSYTRNDLDDTSKVYIGLIAQEVETMYPELVENKNDIKSINYQSIIAILVECVKELKCEINKLKS
jgi:hypothetical protein